MQKTPWLAILVAAIALNAVQTNLVFATNYTLLWFGSGLVLSPIWWLLTRKRRKEPWRWYDWLNAAAYVMVILFVLRFIAYSYMSGKLS